MTFTLISAFIAFFRGRMQNELTEKILEILWYGKKENLSTFFWGGVHFGPLLSPERFGSNVALFPQPQPQASLTLDVAY